jgi:hypothetical protein
VAIKAETRRGHHFSGKNAWNKQFFKTDRFEKCADLNNSILTRKKRHNTLHLVSVNGATKKTSTVKISGFSSSQPSYFLHLYFTFFKH